MSSLDKLSPVYDLVTLEDVRKLDVKVNLNQFGESGSNPHKRISAGLPVYNMMFHHKVFWPHKFATSAPKEVASGYDQISDRYFSGINFATQDYMGMCAHEGSIKVAADALKDFGTHSGNTPNNFGNNKYTLEAIDTVAQYFDCLFGKTYAHIFSAGWLAGYGAIRGLCQENDIIIMDSLGHNCLKEGAKASRAKTLFHDHIDVDDLERVVVKARKEHPNNSILIVTESLFSMDSDCPDLGRIQQIAKNNDATLLVDSAHDMFGTGENGRGYASDMIKDFSNVLIIGSGSKALSANFGYLVTGNKDIYEMLKSSCPSHLSCDILPPPVAAHVTHNLKIMASEEGYRRRAQLVENCNYITERLVGAGFEVIGFPSPIIIVFIGSEFMCRAISNMMYYRGIIVNSVEYPAVGFGQSRLRLQIQATHTREHLDKFVDELAAIIPEVEQFLETDPKALYMQEQTLNMIQDMYTQKPQKLQEDQLPAVLCPRSSPRKGKKPRGAVLPTPFRGVKS